MPRVDLPRRFVAFAVLFVAGCSSSGNLFSFAPQNHRLTKTARSIRESSPDPPDVPRELDKQVTQPYVVEPGDVLLVQPASLESSLRLPGDQPVLPDGTIKLGQYGLLIAAGKTIQQIEGEAQRLVQGQVKETVVVTARLVSRQTKYYYVLGEVNAPGAFAYNGYETVLQGLMSAGGLNDRASRRSIILARPTRPNTCRKVLPVCYEDIVQLGDTSTNYQLSPGDRIYVPARSCRDEKQDRKHGCGVCDRPQFGCPPTPGKPGPLLSNNWHPPEEPPVPGFPMPGLQPGSGALKPQTIPGDLETAPPARLFR